MPNLQQLTLPFQEEIWKDIEEFEGYYQISNFQRVKSLKRIVSQKHTGTVTVPEKILSEYIASKTGYRTVSLRKDGIHTKITIHRLVAMAFVPGYGPHLDVNHIDGNKMNCAPSNLEWGTRRYNVQHATKFGLNKTKQAYMANAKKIIDTSTGDIYESIADAGRKTGISSKRLSNYLTGHRHNKTTLIYLSSD